MRIYESLHWFLPNYVAIGEEKIYSSNCGFEWKFEDKRLNTTFREEEHRFLCEVQYLHLFKDLCPEEFL